MKCSSSLLVLLACSASALSPAPANTAAGRELRVTHAYSGGYGSGTTYGQRNQGSWIGFLAGFALLFIAPWFLVMTELQGVKVAKLINQARASTLANVSSTTLDKSLEGVMVHTNGPLSVREDCPAYVDNGTGVTFGAGSPVSAQVPAAGFSFPLRAGSGSGAMVASSPLRLRRTVEVYQWVEHESKDDYETQIRYTTEWLEVDVPSAGFKFAGHDNPTTRCVDLHSSSIDRPQPCIGAYGLSPTLLAKAEWWGDAWVHPSTELVPALAAAGARILNGLVYVPSGNAPPPGDVEAAIGDMRIKYATVEIPATEGTAVGVVDGGTLRSYTSSDARRIGGDTDAEPPASDEASDEALKREVDELMSGAGSGGGGCGKCCNTFRVLSTVFAKLLAFVMTHVIGTEVSLLSPLRRGSNAMFLTEEVRIEKALSTFRLVGTVLFIGAFYLILHPIAALFSFIPFLGKLISSLFLVAAVIVGLSLSLLTISAAWLLCKPLRACIAFASLDALYYALIYYDPLTATTPLYVLGCLAFVAALLAACQAYGQAQFQAAARGKLATISYTQVGTPIGAGQSRDAKLAATAKEMV